MSKRVLISWVGHTDLRALAGTLPEAERRKVLAEIGATEPIKDLGPVKSLTELEAFDEVRLLRDGDPKITREFAKWIGRHVTSHPVNLENPSDHGEIYEVTREVLDDLPDLSKDELCFHLSPGTPAMAAIWILLAKSLYPATLFQTYKNKAWVTEIPFDLRVDVIPQVLKEPDRLWQHLADKAPSEVSGFEGIVGDSSAIRQAVGRARRAAIRDVSVLIVGESGTGKEMFARAIHDSSRRKGKPFVAINCAAMSKELLESELFGHKKHAFTGAEREHDGAFAQADGGTLFLDEVGECDLAMQAKLLRALQPPPRESATSRVYRKVGAQKDSASNVRIVAATNKDLREAIDAGEFREDLLYRLATISLRLPSLAQRKKDIPLIATELLDQINKQFKGQEPGYDDKNISKKTKLFLSRADWPGNVRQLHNALVQAAVMADGDTLEPRDIAAAIADLPGAVNADVMDCPIGDGFNIDAHLDELRKHFILRAMSEAGGKKTQAARLLGMKSYQTLDAQIKRLKIKP